MKKLILLSVLFVSSLISAQVKMNFNFTTPYGNNSKVGKYAELNGAKIYYEEYGQGEPMLLIHGNGSSIKDMGNQIDYFKSKYHIIVADNRGHGKSELKTDSLTYTQIPWVIDSIVFNGILIIDKMFLCRKRKKTQILIRSQNA
jgi:hypothetical protein